MTERVAAPQERDLDWAEISARTGYVRIPEWLVDRADLSVYAKATYTVIARHINRKTSDAWPGIDRIASLVGCSPRKVRDAQAELRDAGLLVSRRRGLGMTNVYRLRFTEPPEGVASGAGQGANDTPGAVCDVTGDRSGSSSSADLDRPGVPGNQTEENQTEREPAAAERARAGARAGARGGPRGRAHERLGLMLEHDLIGEGSETAAYRALDEALDVHGPDVVERALDHVAAWGCDTVRPLLDRRLSVQLPAAIRKVRAAA